MKSFIMFIFVTSIAIAIAQSAKSKKRRDYPPLPPVIPGLKPNEAKILYEIRDNHPDGSYHFLYLQNDGQYRTEAGEIGINDETKKPVIAKVNGAYEFIRTDGKLQRVEYYANKNGFYPRVTVRDYVPRIYPHKDIPNKFSIDNDDDDDDDDDLN